MCRKSLLSLFLLLGLAASLAAADASRPPVVDPEPAVSLQSALPGAEGACLEEPAANATPADPATPEWLSSSCCISRCFSDRSCDRVCGPNNGVCVQVNSCCRTCACLS